MQITNAIPVPKAAPKPERKPRVKKVHVPDRLKKAAKEYKRAYLAVYGMRPRLSFDGTWIRLQGQREGISLKRLKELTTQLNLRAGV